MDKNISKRGRFALLIILAGLLAMTYFITRPRVVPGQTPLADISTIETLRTQFNQDAGKIRLIILVSPT